MTLLDIVLTVPAADGSQLPAQGVLRFAPTKRRVLNGTTVLPKPFQVPIPLGMAEVDLAANDASWVWRIDEHVSGTSARTIYANIPEAASVSYADLVSIDPATLSPTAEPSAAWTARVDVLESTIADDIGAKLDAETAAATYAAKSVETSKLDATEAATTYAAISVETSKLDVTAAAETYAAKSLETSKLDASEVGAADGVAPLGADSIVPGANLPAHLTQAALDAAYAAPALTADPDNPGLYLIGA